MGLVFATVLAMAAAGASALLPSTESPFTRSYGRASLQIGDLRVPRGQGPFPVAVLVHGGCWHSKFADRSSMGPLAEALTSRGLATWNISYRRNGDAGGGWPGTFKDIGAATDHLRLLAQSYPLDLRSVSIVGHSAGAHLALWAASRRNLKHPVAGADPLKFESVFAIDGPGTLAAYVGEDKEICGEAVIEQLMGGAPAARADLYGLASPQDHLPLGSKTFLVTGEMGRFMLPYARAAKDKGDEVVVLSPRGADHFNLIKPGSAVGDEVVNFIAANVRGSDPIAGAPPPSKSPEVFEPGVLSSPTRHDWSFAFFDEENRIVMQRSPSGDLGYTDWSLYEAERTAEGWSEPRWIASLNRPAGAKWSDGDPAISSDGRKLIYSSNRTGNDDLFVSHRLSEGWSAPVRLSDEINSPAGEYLPWLDPDGNLYFETNRRLGGDRFDIYMAPRHGDGWGKAEPVPGLSTDEAAESSPFISRDGRLLLFIRKPGDIMLSERLGDKWSQPRNLNVGFQGSMQFRPYISDDGEWLYFTSIASGQAEIYRVSAKHALGCSASSSRCADTAVSKRGAE